MVIDEDTELLIRAMMGFDGGVGVVLPLNIGG